MVLTKKMREKTIKVEVKEEPEEDDGEQELPARRLRARKQVSYVQDQEDDGDGDSDQDEWKDEESQRKTRKKSPIKRPPPSETSTSVEESSDEDDDYEKLRQKNIKERMELVKALGIADLKEEIGGPSKKKPVKPKKPVTPREKSTRLRSIIEDKIAREARRKLSKPSPKKLKSEIVQSTLENLRVTIAKATSRKPPGPLPMLSLKCAKEEQSNEDDPDDAASKCADFVSLLRPFLVHRGDESQLSSCSLDTFKKIVSRLKLNEDMIAKTNIARITSMAVHPGEEKVLIASGSTSGDLGLWDVYNPDEEKCVEVLGPHTSQVNCTSFDRFNPTKILTTSLDGTVRRGDLLKLVFEEIWAHDQNGPNTHATWHDQMDANTLLVAHGTGRVVCVDSRKPLMPVGWFECHERSVRTVQKHPQENKFFVTSSGLGEVRIWDLRMMDQSKPEPVWNLVHPKGLTSAFFSFKGNLLLTTCNDDRLRVYHTALLPGPSKPKVVTNIKHDNHTGPWTSVFKAMWHPQREDVFMVGSMDKPRKLQIFGIHGQPVCNLTSEHLVTIPAVTAWHPTLPLIAGANSAGRVHVFR